MIPYDSMIYLIIIQIDILIVGLLEVFGGISAKARLKSPWSRLVHGLIGLLSMARGRTLRHPFHLHEASRAFSFPRVEDGGSEV